MTFPEKPYSADYFGEYRDSWWHRDFLELMARRLEFDQVHTVLDVGCGIGHWGQTLAWALPRDTQITGVDRESELVERATALAVQRGLGMRCRYTTGDTSELLFLDSTFDMVTCQNVLIHLGDPEAALREMVRVTKPGGLILAVEPSNVANETVSSSITVQTPIEELADRYRLFLTCQRGKCRLGLGFLSFGDLLPGCLSKLGVSDVRVYLSDKASPLFPPYDGVEQREFVEQIVEWNRQDLHIADKSEMRRLFLGGGGSEYEFEKLWDLVLKEGHELSHHLAAGTYDTGGAGVRYLVSARKPREGDVVRAITVQEVQDKDTKRQLSSEILHSLSRWFGIDRTIAAYVNTIEQLPSFAAQVRGQPAGFVSVELHNSYSAEIHVMAVLEEFHRQGVGRALIAAAEDYSRRHGVEYIMIKIMGSLPEDHKFDQTRRFCLAQGFRPLQELKTIWEEHSPCLIMVKRL